MKKFEITVCREVWGTIVIEAGDQFEAFTKAENGEYESEFKTTKIGNEAVYNAKEIEIITLTCADCSREIEENEEAYCYSGADVWFCKDCKREEE